MIQSENRSTRIGITQEVTIITARDSTKRLRTAEACSVRLSLVSVSLFSSEDSTYLVGCDEAHLLRYSEFRAVQQRPDAPTLRLIDYLKTEPAIKAILTGHLHFSFESMLTPTLPQFVTGGAYEGVARELTIL